MQEPRPDPGAVLSLEGVTRTFGEVTAVADLDLQVAAGEVVGLLGHNGAGKTTTVRLLAGLLAPDRGQVRVAGLDPTVDGPAVRQQLGVLPSTPVVDDRLTARANLRFAADVFGTAPVGLDERIVAALDRFELADRADERVSGFSTGMRQRLSLARILLPDPGILLLDEPTSALDPVAARHVRQVIASLARDEQRTVVLCTHDLVEAEQSCDRVVVLEHGRAVLQGAPADLTAEHGSAAVDIEVAPDAVELARSTVVAIASGVDVEVEGGCRLRATGLTRDQLPQIVHALSAAHVSVYEVRRRQPTLEDVYLALHLGAGEDGS